MIKSKNLDLKQGERFDRPPCFLSESIRQFRTKRTIHFMPLYRRIDQKSWVRILRLRNYPHPHMI
jgi:hypothetical protein